MLPRAVKRPEIGSTGLTERSPPSTTLTAHRDTSPVSNPSAEIRSRLHEGLQESSAAVLPSSHCSTPSMLALPQSEAGMVPDALALFTGAGTAATKSVAQLS